MIWLRWTINGGERPTKSKRSQRGDRRCPAKPPLMTKLVLQEWSFGYVGVKSQKIFLTFLGFKPVLYIEILVEANESGVNFLNGY